MVGELGQAIETVHAISGIIKGKKPEKKVQHRLAF